MTILLTEKWRVDMRASFLAPAPRAHVWEALSDFETFACRDLFHDRITLEADRPGAGVGFRLHHGLAGVGFERQGRVLTWTEGAGYVFSDLSTRDPRRGFPHIYWFRLHDEPDGCRVELGVGGRWTARRIPRVLIRAWLETIWLAIRLRVEMTLLGRLRRRCVPAAR